MCKACSPGGRFLTFSFMFTPLPPFPSESTAVPTLCPFASFNSTVTGLLAAWIAAAPKNRATRVTVAFLIPFILTQKKEAGVRGRHCALLPYCFRMLRFETAGESHGECLVATLVGLPAGVPVSSEEINRELWRRHQGYGRCRRMTVE